MAVIIDRDACVGCETCIGVCPTGALYMDDGKAQVKADVCISCGACVNECPVGAISLPAEKAETAAPVVKGKDLWVFVELEDGKPVGVVYELLAEARRMADKSGQRCCAALIAKEKGDVPRKLIAVGADVVYVVAGEEFADYNTELYTHAFCELVKAYNPSAVLVGATVDGRDLGPRIAARLNTGLCADCTGLEINDEQVVEWTRPALGGNILATILCTEHFPQMGTVRPKVFKALPADESREGEVVEYALKEKGVTHTQLVRKDPVAGEGMTKIEDAEILCSGGRGMGCQESFAMLQQLADVLGGTVAGSRAVVDEGWITHAQQVGQSGKTVTPKVYFACGISGAIQHLAGMTSSDIIIAINRDANAPIFKIAHYGIVGDVNAVLPKLIEKLKAVKNV